MVDSFRERAKKLPTWSTLQRDDQKLMNVNETHLAGMSRLDRIAVWVTDKIGTMGFFIIIFVWTVVWLGWNVVGPAPLRFDPTQPSCCGSLSRT